MNAIMSPRLQMVISWIVLAVAVFGWPLSQLTVARSEPPFILGLSWFAIVWTAWGNIVSAQVNKDVATGCEHVCAACEKGES